MKERSYACYSVASALAFAASSACGMTAPAAPAARCEVLNGNRLSVDSGGREELCAAIERAAIARGLGGAYTVRVVVGSNSLLTADVMLSDGRALPAVSMAEMDRPIGKTTLKRFAEAVADHVVGASR